MGALIFREKRRGREGEREDVATIPADIRVIPRNFMPAGIPRFFVFPFSSFLEFAKGKSSIVF